MTAALHSLLAHVEQQRDQALSLVLRAEDHLRHLRQQAEQLAAYRDEYRQRHPARGGRSASIDVLRTHNDFMQRLEQALSQQQVQLHAAEARAGALRRDLLALETRVASVRKLMERREQHAAVVSNRSEQRRADEASQRGHRRASARAIDWRLDSEHAPLTH